MPSPPSTFDTGSRRSGSVRVRANAPNAEHGDGDEAVARQRGRRAVDRHRVDPSPPAFRPVPAEPGFRSYVRGLEEAADEARLKLGRVGTEPGAHPVRGGIFGAGPPHLDLDRVNEGAAGGDVQRVAAERVDLDGPHGFARHVHAHLREAQGRRSGAGGPGRLAVPPHLEAPRRRGRYRIGRRRDVPAGALRRRIRDLRSVQAKGEVGPGGPAGGRVARREGLGPAQDDGGERAPRFQEGLDDQRLACAGSRPVAPQDPRRQAQGEQEVQPVAGAPMMHDRQWRDGGE